MTTSNADIPSPELQKKYRILNFCLIAVLAALTCKKALAVILTGSLSLYSLAGLIVPAINIYFIRLLLGFRKMAYQLVFILSILSLVYPENRLPVEFGLHLLLIVMSVHLYLRLFSGKVRS